MQIVIPMSGFGERFRKAGYDIPKPLICIDNKPIIEYIVEMYPGATNFIFICNKDHLSEPSYNMEQILKRIAPKGKIVPIEPHKLGPVHAVLKAIDYIDLKQQVIINYADFTCDWNYADFCKKVDNSQCDGAIPCYRGFHPHTLWSNYYAYVPEKNMFATDIQEKKPFTDSPREEFASSGTYYFRNGSIMLEYFERCIFENLTVAGEYYVSMVYKPMIDDGLEIQVYELNHFMQWGTPSDLEEYCYWSNIFNSIINETKPPKHNGALILPMVGLGSRFQKDGYKTPKPLIEVSGKAMAVQALMDLPETEKQNFIIRKDMLGNNELEETLKINSSNGDFIFLDHMTDGQASTCFKGLSGITHVDPVTIAACDNGMIYDSNNFHSLMNSKDIDIIVWGARGYPGAIRSPEMYGWLDVGNENIINSVSVKTPLSDPTQDPIVIGTFTFKKLEYFIESYHRMKNRGSKINGEYYVDTLINDAIKLGLRCVLFEIDSYICWGTPNDLRTFEYWQSCFNSWESHPYELTKDINFLNKKII